MELDWAEVEASGLLADADDVDDRKALLAWLAGRGFTIPEMLAAQARGALLLIAGEQSIRPGAGELSLTDVADRTGVPLDVVQRILRSLGALVPDPEAMTSSEDDVELVTAALLVLERFGDRYGFALLRRYGSLVERLTEATSSATIHAVPDISTLHSGSEVVTAKAFAEVAEAVPRVGRILDLTMRHHIEAVRRYFEEAGAGGTSQSAFELGVGFVDLSGYTSTTLAVGLPELGTLVGDFEARVTDVISDLGGRIVKFVGDAVLFVSHDADALARMAFGILEPDATDGGMAAKAALTYGTVLARDGDYFGPSVNLAARLVAVAPERGILVDGDLRARLDPERWSFVDQPLLDLKGIGEPVAAAQLLPR